MNKLARTLPVLLVAVSAGWLGSKGRPARDVPGQMQIHEFGRLPVVYQGRVKPFDTLARNSLLVLSDRQTYRGDGQKQPSIRWLLDVISQSEAADKHKIFRTLRSTDILVLP